MSDKPARRRVALSGQRLVLFFAALLLPALSLIPLGSLWLWNHGYILYWAGATCVVVTLIYFVLGRYALPDATVQSVAPDDVPRQLWTRRQEEAWQEVLAFAGAVGPDRIGSREDLLALGLETVGKVATRMHPDRSDPLLHFTLPEAFAVIEQASAGLRDFVEANVPFGDRITIGQMLWIYRWRTVVPMVERGYDIWRIIRLINPISAATQELRERTTRELYDMGREHIARRLTEAFIKEVGRAAVDLYGGTMRVRQAQLAARVTEPSQRDTQALESVAAEPIRILVVGQTGVGKSSVINALTGSLDAAVDVLPATRQQVVYRIVKEGMPAALLVDTPGLDDRTRDAEVLTGAEDSDMILWVTAATRAARERDRAALESVRQHFAESVYRMPPVLVVLTQIDRLRPFGEWAPPIDIVHGTSDKARSIRGAIEAVERELGVDAAQIIPVRTDAPATNYNVDALWARMLEVLPEARRSRLLRCLREAKGEWNWGNVLTQAANAGRLLGRTMLRG